MFSSPHLLSLALLAIPQVSAIVPPRYEALLFALQKRTCAVPCGYNDAYCCGSNSVCYTDAQTRAQCAASTAYAAITAYGSTVYTTVYTDTLFITRTSVYTVWNGAATTYVAATPTTYIAQSTAICGAGLQACGAICCGSGYYCYASGNCRASATATVIIGGSTSLSAPLRPTSATTTTTIVPVTTTQGFQTPVSTASGTLGITAADANNGLSGGAIAGIVIGVIAGIILLILICFCCCLKAGFDGLLAIFGLGSKNKRRERTEVVEERYTRYGRAGTAGAAVRRDDGRTWYGGQGGGGGARYDNEKRSSNNNEAKTLLGLGGGLAGLAAILGLRRREEERRQQQQRRRPARSEVSYTSYTDSYTGTSASKFFRAYTTCIELY